MTIIIGVLCQDGIVIGTDSSATFVVTKEFRTIEQKCKKVFIINNNTILSSTGEIGLGQRFERLLEWRGKKKLLLMPIQSKKVECYPQLQLTILKPQKQKENPMALLWH